MKPNRHSIIVKTVDARGLREQIILWGEASWWPGKSLMKFERLTQGRVESGTRYRQRVLLPLAPAWCVEVTSLTERSITRTFLDGMFRGFETVSFSPHENGFKVAYEMNYEVQGLANRCLWPVFFRRLHDRNIEEILKSLKAFMEKI